MNTVRLLVALGVIVLAIIGAIRLRKGKGFTPLFAAAYGLALLALIVLATTQAF